MPENPLYKSLLKPGANANASGIRCVVYYAPKSWIKTFPKVSALPLTPEESVTIAEDFEMVVGKTFLKIHSTQGKGKLTFDTVGETPHTMVVNKAALSFPDITLAALAFTKASLNDDIVYVVQELHQTEKRHTILGHEDYDTDTKIKGDSGDKPGSDKGLTIAVEATDYTPLPHYSGSLITEDGTLDCETGIITPTV